MASADIVHAVNTLVNELQPLIPQPCNKGELSASPSKFIPSLRYILENYTVEHQENEAAAYIAGLSINDKRIACATKTLPKLFALFPIPKFQWRFISLNAKALKALVSLPATDDDYDGNADVFNYVFRLKEYGFKRYGT